MTILYVVTNMRFNNAKSSGNAHELAEQLHQKWQKKDELPVAYTGIPGRRPVGGVWKPPYRKCVGDIIRQLPVSAAFRSTL